MTMIKSIRFVLTLIALVVLTACDPTYPLFLRNGLETQVTVQTKFEEGVSSEGVLQPGERLTFLHPEGKIASVIVYSEGHILYEFDKQALLDMHNSVSDPRQVTWNIQSDGVKPLSRAEMGRLESE
ncbi:MAG: hypothetical protein ACNA7J_09630 [Wenzhouxiangella sp.]